MRISAGAAGDGVNFGSDYDPQEDDPQTIVLWERGTDDSGTFISKTTGGATNTRQTQIYATGGEYRWIQGGTVNTPTTGGDIADGTLFQLINVVTETPDLSAYKNGTLIESGGSIGTAVETSASWRTHTRGGFTSVNAIGEVAIWNVELNSSEITSLSHGVSPFVIRRDQLRYYLPIYGIDSPEPTYGTVRTSGTVTNASRSVPNPPVELIENYL